MDEIRPVLLKHNITEQQWRVLRVVDESEGAIDASSIAQQACLLAPSLTRILRTLTEQNFVTTQRDPQDARRTLIQITDKGENLLDTVAPETLAIFHEMRDAIGEDHWLQLVNILADFRDKLKERNT